MFAIALAGAGCGDDGGGTATESNEIVRQRIEALAPSANLGHRGTGPTRTQSQWPENSLAAFAAAMAQGADGIELDVELTADGELLVLHDDTLDRTTTCSGCLSAYSFAAARECRLLDGARQASGETLPTLAEVYDLLPRDALVNVELKVYGDACQTPDTGGAVLARRAAVEVQRLDAAARTLFSSFDRDALLVLKREFPQLYAAPLVGTPSLAGIEELADLGFDAIHPSHSLDAERIAAARELGLQVNLWTVNGRGYLEGAVDKQPTAIITDEPGVLAEVLAARR